MLLALACTWACRLAAAADDMVAVVEESGHSHTSQAETKTFGQWREEVNAKVQAGSMADIRAAVSKQLNRTHSTTPLGSAPPSVVMEATATGMVAFLGQMQQLNYGLPGGPYKRTVQAVMDFKEFVMNQIGPLAAAEQAVRLAGQDMDQLQAALLQEGPRSSYFRAVVSRLSDHVRHVSSAVNLDDAKRSLEAARTAALDLENATFAQASALALRGAQEEIDAIKAKRQQAQITYITAKYSPVTAKLDREIAELNGTRQQKELDAAYYRREVDNLKQQAKALNSTIADLTELKRVGATGLKEEHKQILAATQEEQARLAAEAKVARDELNKHCHDREIEINAQINETQNKLNNLPPDTESCGGWWIFHSCSEKKHDHSQRIEALKVSKESSIDQLALLQKSCAASRTAAVDHEAAAQKSSMARSEALAKLSSSGAKDFDAFLTAATEELRTERAAVLARKQEFFDKLSVTVKQLTLTRVELASAYDRRLKLQGKAAEALAVLEAIVRDTEDELRNATQRRDITASEAGFGSQQPGFAQLLAAIQQEAMLRAFLEHQTKVLARIEALTGGTSVTIHHLQSDLKPEFMLPMLAEDDIAGLLHTADAFDDVPGLRECVNSTLAVGKNKYSTALKFAGHWVKRDDPTTTKGERARSAFAHAVTTCMPSHSKADIAQLIGDACDNLNDIVTETKVKQLRLGRRCRGDPQALRRPSCASVRQHLQLPLAFNSARNTLAKLQHVFDGTHALPAATTAPGVPGPAGNTPPQTSTHAAGAANMNSGAFASI